MYYILYQYYYLNNCKKKIVRFYKIHTKVIEYLILGLNKLEL